MRTFSLSQKLIASLAVMAILLGAVCGWVTAVLYREKMEGYYSENAFRAARIAAMNIDGAKIQEYVSTLEPDAYYEEMKAYLLGVKETMGVQYMYVVIPGKERMFYVWDVGRSGEYGLCELGDEDEYYGEGKELMLGVFNNPASEDHILITNSKSYGYLASAYVPVTDRDGRTVALAGVDISMDHINQSIRQFAAVLCAVTFLLLFLFIGLYYLFIKYGVIAPIRTLHRAAGAIVRENLEQGAANAIEVHTGDEIEDLAEAFNFMVGEIREYIGHLNRLTAEKERIETELLVATQIQASMLPCIFPAFPERQEFDLYATMQPAREVGGDFYDFFLVDPDHLGVVIADVSGKGVPAALFMVIAKTLIKNHAQAGEEPEEIFTAVNHQLCENNEAKLFVTAWLGILEISTGRLQYANAGHNPPLLAKKGAGFRILKCDPGFILAGIDGFVFGRHEITLEGGDILFLYTDGVTESTSRELTLYGDQRLISCANRLKDGRLEELVEGVERDIDGFTAGAGQFDDITMLVLRMGQGKEEEVCPEN